jgi:hypothetical protein
VHRVLTPRVDALPDGLVFAADRLALVGDGFLFGGDEGTTVAVLTTADGRTAEAALAAVAADRRHASFVLPPALTGIRPGAFAATLRLENHAADSTTSAPVPLALTIAPPTIFAFTPAAVSLGAYLDVRGGGFAAVTLVELDGRFDEAPLHVTLVPTVVDGRHLRLVVAEDDALGRHLDLRHASGTFTGTARAVVHLGDDVVTSAVAPITFTVAPLRQVVQLDFQPGYAAALHHFGLHAAAPRIAARVLDVCARDYAGVNLDFRLAPPDDVALYTRIDLGGADPNGLGLLGYDNSPGKDVGNLRLHDRIGGVSATTQDDGFPGYGGVFVDSLFGFSAHPEGLAAPLPGGVDPLFDAIFDPFRPDRGGTPVTAAELAALSPPTLTDGSSCPASTRRTQIACAVFVLGSLVGTTTTHELAHALGLANPSESAAFHNPGDAPDRLMDAAAARSFRERAELDGQGPAVFCDGDFAYLRAILPSTDEAPAIARPGCF